MTQQNALTDVAGIRVGHADDPAIRTGVTVLRFDSAMRCAVDVRGGGPATRETPAVETEATLGIAHAITLSGGSVFGLAAADETAAALSAGGVGFSPVGGMVPVPIIPAASLYDLANGGAKDWGGEPPYRKLARQAFAACGADARCGSVGAGYGAVAGSWLGGLGNASAETDGITVAAMIAANPIGSPVMPDGKAFWAWPFERDGEFGGLRPDPGMTAHDPLPADIKGGIATPATCIGVVAVSRPLSRNALKRIAVMAQDGLARAIRPSHAPFDGDTIFAICPDEPGNADPVEVMRLGSAASDCVSRAVARGVWEASAETADFSAFRTFQA